MNRNNVLSTTRHVAVREARDLMHRLDHEPSHAQQVCRLALQLFDQLAILHGYGDEERMLLECAALLHDIGWTTKPTAHHKGSRDAILAESFKGLDDTQKLLVALVARYHRKSHPRSSHKGYRDLASDNRRVVRVLASFLRIADGLDRSHKSNIKDIVCEICEDELILRLIASVPPVTELYGLQKKVGLFEDVFGLSIWPEPVKQASVAQE